MEFVDINRYRNVPNSRIPAYAKLKEMSPLLLTQGLEILASVENLAYLDKLVREGVGVAPVRRVYEASPYAQRLDFPRRILFEMTSRCNLLCRMCPQQNLKRPRMDMDGRVYRRVLDEINEQGVEYLALYHLGESLLHPEFQANVAYLKGKDRIDVVWMSTNGHIFDEDQIRFVLDSRIDWVNFSAHAVSAPTYESVIGAGGFEAVQENLKAWYRLKGVDNLPRRPFLHCQMIDQETTHHEVDPFLAEHHDKAEIVSVNMLEYVNLPNNCFGFSQRERKPLTRCTRVARNDCFICSNGAVTLCDAAYNGEIHLGNVNESSLYDIWNSDARRRILELNEQGRMGEMEFCRSCTDYDI